MFKGGVLFDYFMVSDDAAGTANTGGISGNRYPENSRELLYPMPRLFYQRESIWLFHVMSVAAPSAQRSWGKS
jgi:hypothetical protein